ncbi:hypothetical protein A8H36_25400 [Burkholderia thailandensis]|nr:hypothetical protein A8H36_25400 [Burkholderia thailandensis]
MAPGSFVITQTGGAHGGEPQPAPRYDAVGISAKRGVRATKRLAAGRACARARPARARYAPHPPMSRAVRRARNGDAPARPSRRAPRWASATNGAAGVSTHQPVEQRR